MKCSETWLREWIQTDLTLEAIGERLTMAGLEMESIDPVAVPFTGVVIGEVVATKPHPDAEKLTLCEVNIGKPQTLAIVCGAENVRAQLKVAVAIVGAKLNNDIEIKPTKIRGAASEGMLCSAKELGLSEDISGILELSSDAKIGTVLWDYLALSDNVIDISITPNRGDCLSMLGVSREISALLDKPLTYQVTSSIKPVSKTSLPVTNKAIEACPHYYGRVITHVDAAKKSPIWVQERLRRAGVRSISAVVDATNYVMLELGQPMHAFDLDKIDHEIIIRFAKANELISLLDGSEKTLDTETLVIADKNNALAIAGVMGGMPSCVTDSTKTIFLESAFFTPEIVARQRQHYNLSSESAYRFERGVDHALQALAIERATQLIIEWVGGEPGPVVSANTSNAIALRRITLNFAKIKQVLGIEISTDDVLSIFKRLGLSSAYDKKTAAFEVTVPSYRSDILLPEDLIEEIARLYGYNNIPTQTIHAALITQPAKQDWFVIREFMATRGYQEIVSYSFVDKTKQALLNPALEAKEIENPITADMTVMRTNLWPGLLSTLTYNQSRQQARARLLEVGLCFNEENNALVQSPKMGGLIAGNANPEQWGVVSRQVDFYDLKGDIEIVLVELLGVSSCDFRPDHHPALHPGQTASIYHNDQKIGVMGALHPKLHDSFDVSGAVYLFEIDLNLINNKETVQNKEISKFPEIRRDLSILINEAVPASSIQDTIKIAAGAWLKDIFIFDVYQGKGVAGGLKSVALAMVFQHPARTLVDEEVVGLVNQVVTALQGRYDAHLRS